MSSSWLHSGAYHSPTYFLQVFSIVWFFRLSYLASSGLSIGCFTDGKITKYLEGVFWCSGSVVVLAAVMWSHFYAWLLGFTPRIWLMIAWVFSKTLMMIAWVSPKNLLMIAWFFTRTLLMISWVFPKIFSRWLLGFPPRSYCWLIWFPPRSYWWLLGFPPSSYWWLLRFSARFYWWLLGFSQWALWF